jgi:hypothetical protein
MKSNTPFQAEKEAAAELSKLYYSFKTKSRPKSDFKVLAVMTVFNEKDIVQYTVSKLLKGGIQVHIIDNWSTDGSYEDLQKMASSNPDLTIERFPEQPSATYNLENLLNKVEDIARSSKADWIIHHDSDEIREACWPDISLKEGLSRVDSLGYNSVNFTVLDFRPVQQGFGKGKNPEAFFKYFEFGIQPGNFVQIKAWKNQTGRKIDLKSSGGHEIKFQGRRVFPLKFLLKHYSLRSKSQIHTKLFKDRLSRLNTDEFRKGWHKHYFALKENAQADLDMLWKKGDLLEFDSHTFYDKYFAQRLTGEGIINDPYILMYKQRMEFFEHSLNQIQNSNFYRIWQAYCMIRDYFKRKISS